MKPPGAAMPHDSRSAINAYNKDIENRTELPLRRRLMFEITRFQSGGIKGCPVTVSALDTAG